MVTKEQLKVGQSVVFLGADGKEYNGTITKINVTAAHCDPTDIFWIKWHDARYPNSSIPKFISEIVRILP